MVRFIIGRRLYFGVLAEKTRNRALSSVKTSVFFPRTLSTNTCFPILFNNALCLETVGLHERMRRKHLNVRLPKVWYTKSSFSTKVGSEVKEASENCFQDMVKFRRNQALHSVLIELSSKEDIPFITSVCKRFGGIKEIISYTEDSGSEFFLVEFMEEEAVRSLLASCQCKNITDAFPLYSRFIRYERKKKKTLFVAETGAMNVSTEINRSCTHQSPSVSLQMEEIYKTEKLSDLSIRLRFFFCGLLQDALSGMFPHCAALPFGSSVNGFGKENCDLDVMIRLYAENVDLNCELEFQTKTCVGDIRVLQQRAVSGIGDMIRAFFPGISYVQKIQHARVPIIKFKHKVLGLECDVSVNNMTAVYMSEILYFCAEVDPRIRPLVYTVRKWAKEASVTYGTPGSWITNFSLTLLVMFFLQNRPVPILPPLNKAIGISVSRETYLCHGVEYFENLSKWKSSALQNDETLETLLKEFLHFLTSYPFKEKRISLLTGEADCRNDADSVWIQYPLEEDKNVSKNVSVHELQHLYETAAVSLKHFKMNVGSESKDLMEILGVSILKEMYSDRIDISALYDPPVKDVSKKKKTP